jgi:hypothetical protein
MIDITENILKQDKKNIVLEQLLRHFYSTKNVQIGYNQLKQKCNTRLSELGLGDDYGGVFDNHLRKFSDPSDPERKLTIQRSKTPKRTIIEANVDRIESYFTSENIMEQITSKPIKEDHEIEHKYWIEVERDVLKYHLEHENSLTSLGTRLRHLKDHNFMVEAVSDIQSPMRPSRWKLFISKPTEKEFQFDKSSMLLLYYLAEMHLSKNQFPFEFIISYAGPFNDNEELFSSHEKKESEGKLIDYFSSWCSRFHNHVVREVDKQELLNHKKDEPYNLEDNETLRLYTSFLEEFTKYMHIVIRARHLPPINIRWS